jgi:hypothetical protein
MVGTEMVPETSVVFDELALLLAEEDFINVSHHESITIHEVLHVSFEDIFKKCFIKEFMNYDETGKWVCINVAITLLCLNVVSYINPSAPCDVHSTQGI